MAHGGARSGAGRPAIYGSKMKKVQILIPEDIHKKVKEKAEEEGKTVSEVIREIINKHRI